MGLIQAAMLLEAVGLVVGTAVLGVVWALSEWSLERGQTLGVLWLGALGGAALLAWLSMNIAGSRTGTARR